MKTRDAALKFASKGWHVIPVHSVRDNGFCSCGAVWDYSTEPKHAIGKHPYTGQDGHRTASDDEMQIHTWWMLWPDCNVSIATGAKSNLIVVDVDKKNGGLESLKLLFPDGLPKTPTVHSGGGGLHLYFKHPGFEVRGRRDMLPGIDVMADGGRIVAPPSSHKSGERYKWDEKLNEDFALADVPSDLLTRILSKQSKRKRPDTQEQEQQTDKFVPAKISIIRNRRF